MFSTIVPVREYDHIYVVADPTCKVGFRLVEFNAFHKELGHRVSEDKAYKLTKRCLANLCTPELTDNVTWITLVCPQSMLVQAALYACHNIKDGELKPLWTQSGGKNGTFAMVPLGVFDRLSRPFDQAKDAEVFAAYIGLLFSDVTADPVLRTPAVWGIAKHGEDGNGVVGLAEWGKRAQQVRMLSIDDEGWPCLLGKGILQPVADWAGVSLNDTMIKWASPEATEIIIARTNVTDKPSKFPVTFLVTHLVEDCPEVRAFFKSMVQGSTKSLLSLITERNIPALLARLGAMNVSGGKLLTAKRNALSALRSNLPWCIEAEARLGRVFVREIVERIAPSAGLFGWGYLAIQHDEYGRSGITLDVIRKDIKANPYRMAFWLAAIKSMAFRIPLMSAANIVCFKFVLSDGRVHPDVMAAMDGDSDGDKVVVVKDRQFIALMLGHAIILEVGAKPDPVRNQSPITAARQVDLAVQAVEDGAYVGILTMRAHVLLAAGRLQEAAECAWLAKIAPMLHKWDIPVGEIPARLACHLEASKQTGVALWKVQQRKAKKLDSLRDLVGLEIADPKSLQDRLWNWTIETVTVWAGENELAPLNLLSVARIAVKSHGGKAPSGQNHAWARNVVSVWGGYWEDHYDDPTGTSHSVIYKQVAAMGAAASPMEKVALLLWTPRREGSTGFALKWHAMGVTWEEVLGLRPAVAEVVSKKVDDAALKMLCDAVAEALIGL